MKISLVHIAGVLKVVRNTHMYKRLSVARLLSVNVKYLVQSNWEKSPNIRST